MTNRRDLSRAGRGVVRRVIVASGGSGRSRRGIHGGADDRPRCGPLRTSSLQGECVMPERIIDWFLNKEGQREPLDGWANDEHLPPDGDDWVHGAAPPPGQGDDTAEPGEALATKRSPRRARKTARQHPDVRRQRTASIMRVAQRFPHWNAESISRELRKRGVHVEAAEVALVTARALPPPVPPKQVKGTNSEPTNERPKRQLRTVSTPTEGGSRTGATPAVTRMRRRPSTTRPPRSAASSSLAASTPWAPDALRLYEAHCPRQSLAALRAELTEAGYAGVTRAQVKRVLQQAGVLFSPTRKEQSRSRRSGTGIRGTHAKQAETCGSCSGPIDVQGHCRCN